MLCGEEGTAMTIFTGSGADVEFQEGYRDGRDPDAPEPSANRSHAYRHSFAVGRAELAKRPIAVAVARVEAALAEEQAAQAWAQYRTTPADVERRTGLHRATIRRKIRAGQFPGRVSLGPNSTGWYESDVNAWVTDPMGWHAAA